jgi:hypothetical protein
MDMQSLKAEFRDLSKVTGMASLITAIDAKKDAVVIELIDDRITVHIECKNKENEEHLRRIARSLIGF